MGKVIWKRLWRLLTEGRGGPGGSSDPNGVFITEPPDNFIGESEDNAVFTVVAVSGNASALSYQWQEKIAGSWGNLTDGGRISGATTNELTLTDMIFGDTGRLFRVQVTNDTNSKYFHYT